MDRHPERHLGALTWGVFAMAFLAGQMLDGDQARRAVAGGAVVGLALLARLAHKLRISLRLDVDPESVVLSPAS